VTQLPSAGGAVLADAELLGEGDALAVAVGAGLLGVAVAVGAGDDGAGPGPTFAATDFATKPFQTS
jgi:hypothetical protein